MFKKVVIVLIVVVVVLIVIFNINKKEEIKNNHINKISILLETEEGNIKTNSFPSKEEYSFDKIDCTNLNSNTNVTPSFNSETWKLNLTATSTEKLNESIGNYSWDTTASGGGFRVNQWGESGDYEGADLMRLLKPGYESESINNSLYYNNS